MIPALAAAGILWVTFGVLAFMAYRDAWKRVKR